MSKECKYCHKVGFHKLSCPTKKVVVFLKSVSEEDIEENKQV